jgi:hypothetical protein
MALKQETPKAQPADDTLPIPDDTVLLELAMYTNYTWGGNTYEQGQAYRFKRSEAMILLSEHDLGRAIWQIHRPARPKQTPKNLVVDATEVTAIRTRQSIEQVLKGTPTQKRIDVGTDDEIADILARDGGAGDVTV